MTLKEESCELLVGSRQREFAEPDDKAGDTYLSTDITELSHHSFNQMRKPERSTELCVYLARAGFCGFLYLGQLREINQKSDEKKDSGDDLVRCLHHVRFRDTIVQQLRGRHRGLLRGRVL